MKITTVTLILLLGWASSIPAATIKGRDKRTVEMFVEQEREVEANSATLKLILKKSGKDLASAAAACSSSMAGVRKFLEKGGLKPEQIITREFQSYPAYSFLAERARQVNGYLDITLTSAGRIARLLDQLERMDPDLILDKITFGHTNEDSIKADMIKEAARKAEVKKVAYGIAFKVKLRLLEAVEGITTELPGQYEQMGMPDMMAGSSPPEEKEMLISDEPVLKYKMTLSVVYEIIN